jgi:hypothetical protein
VDHHSILDVLCFLTRQDRCPIINEEENKKITHSRRRYFTKKRTEEKVRKTAK